MGGPGVAGGELTRRPLNWRRRWKYHGGDVGMSAEERISASLPGQRRTRTKITLTTTSFNTSYSFHTWVGFRQIGFLLFCIIIWGVHIPFFYFILSFSLLTTLFSFTSHYF
ncbi:hypothetical protein C7212DRAFT_300892 [Tuber magnatum]|uniref:Uncharacterized protein n=1 Tax=Tuber magnatum TaxID=42249 RepID=A0A317SEL0_9PEZI|nr:hypothetical protein C7212DRAFT_300892 [Tuber magnatum]